MNIERNNINKLYVCNVIINLFVLLFCGAVLQTLLIERGVPEEKVNIYISVMQIVQTLSMLLLSEKMDSVKNVIKWHVLPFYAAVPFAVFLVILSLNGDFFADKTIFVLYATGILFNFFYSLHMILTYKLPYHVMDMKIYGRYTAIVGIVSSIAALIITSLLSFFQKMYGFFEVMSYLYFASLILTFVLVFLGLSLKRVNKEIVSEKKENRKINIFKYKPFYSLLIPNFLRGFCSGIIGLAVSIGFSQNLLDAQSSSYLVIITNAATITGCLFYGLISMKKIEDKLVFLSSLSIFVFLPVMFFGKSTMVFLFFYGIMYFFFILINYGTPVLITRIVDYDVMGQYTSWRLLVSAAGTALAGFCCSGMLEFFGAVLTMLITGSMQLVSGVWYYVYVKKVKKI